MSDNNSNKTSTPTAPGIAPINSGYQGQPHTRVYKVGPRVNIVNAPEVASSRGIDLQPGQTMQVVKQIGSGGPVIVVPLNSLKE
uniref:Uncharacterized protein n=1 Tax=Plectus sambesii TaxID=2011161 RepID=A0A914WLL3_9BILA